MKLNGKKVFVGLSGGVDSAVSAALLKEAGAEVTSVFIKGWYPEGLPCTWARDRQDAMQVAAKLGIPFYTLDASAEYKRAVIDYLIREYKEGRTPNPDIMCNREVKFGAFYRFAREKGADFIATGHYARIENGTLLRGVDPAKDQSYFLWAIPKETLAHLLFPLGGMKKERVRTLGRSFDLPVAEKKDSQGICFLGPVSIEDFLRAEVGLKKGKALDETGKEIGTHEGAIAYTLGERATLGGGAPGPWYVLKKDLERNEIVVSHVPRLKESSSESIALTNLNFLSNVPAQVEAQYRYHGPVVRGRFTGSAFTSAELAEPVAAGQSLVFYEGERLLGGGIIC